MRGGWRVWCCPPPTQLLWLSSASHLTHALPSRLVGRLLISFCTQLMNHSINGVNDLRLRGRAVFFQRHCLPLGLLVPRSVLHHIFTCDGQRRCYNNGIALCADCAFVGSPVTVVPLCTVLILKGCSPASAPSPPYTML